MLMGAVDAALSGNREGADAVAVQSADLDRRYAEVHDCLLGLIARQGPVAGDLRRGMALLHVNDRLARMGAKSVSVPPLCRAIPDGGRPSSKQLGCLSEMA